MRRSTVNETMVHVWAAVEVESFEIIHIEVSHGRSDLDALLFLRTVLRRHRGRPVIVINRGPWYNWAVDDFDSPNDSRRKTWGELWLVEAWFELFKYHTRLFYSRFPYRSSWRSTQRWAGAFAVFHKALL